MSTRMSNTHVCKQVQIEALQDTMTKEAHIVTMAFIFYMVLTHRILMV